MTHRFQVGQTISATGLAILPGPFRIVRLLPLSESGVPQYHVTSTTDGHDRIFAERRCGFFLVPPTPTKKSLTSRGGVPKRGGSRDRIPVRHSSLPRRSIAERLLRHRHPAPILDYRQKSLRRAVVLFRPKRVGIAVDVCELMQAFHGSDQGIHC